MSKIDLASAEISKMKAHVVPCSWKLVFDLVLCLVFIPRDHVFLKCGHFKKHCGAYGETIFLAEILLVQPVGNIFYR